MYHEGVWKGWGMDLPLKKWSHRVEAEGESRPASHPPERPSALHWCHCDHWCSSQERWREKGTNHFISPFLFFRGQGLLRQRFSWISLWLLYLQCQIWNSLVCQTGVFSFLNTVFSFIILGKKDAKTNWKLPKLWHLLGVFYKVEGFRVDFLSLELKDRAAMFIILITLRWGENLKTNAHIQCGW